MTEEFYLFIADISGYTHFMLSNQQAYDHAILIVTELMEGIVKQIELPLKISKLEGDAVFFYLAKEEMKGLDAKSLGAKLIELISIFSNQVTTLKASISCKCGGCMNVDQLQLKIITHFGTATLAPIGSFYELSGVNVILAHRLLKNHVQGHRYLLFTEAAFKEIALPDEMKIVRQTENIPEIGSTSICVCLFQENKREAQPMSGWQNLWSHAKLFVKSSLLKIGIKKAPVFRNLPDVKS